MNTNDKIKRWLEGELSDAEKREFERTEEFVQLTRLMKALDHFAAPHFDAEKEYHKLLKNIPEKKQAIPFHQKFHPLYRIAAIFILALLMGYFVFNQFRDEPVKKEWVAEQSTMYLPDSSFVSLNADSRIRFSESGWDEKRMVEIRGEAFFRVKKGAPFHVKTRQGRVAVLGTEFEVKDRDDYFGVTCYSGLVEVVTAQHTVVLQPQSVFRIVNRKAENYAIKEKKEPDWINGESSFKSVPLKFVIDELERQYQVSVEAKNVDLNHLFTGSFTHKNLEIALESITFPVNLDYQINGNQIVLSFEGK